jgi:hypothetical protein
MVVHEVRLEDRAQVAFADDDDVVEAFAANGANETFREWILPRRMRGGLDLLGGVQQ